MRGALCVAAAALALTACVPPPPPEPTGSPTADMQIVGLGFIPPGNTLPCTLSANATVSLMDDTSARVITKARTGGPCPPEAWLFNAWIGCQPDDCGQPAVPLSATVLIPTDVYFTRPIDRRRLVFRVWASLAGQTATASQVSTLVLCRTDGSRCYFQPA